MTAMPELQYVYRARVERVVDGDTLDVTISQGLHTYRTERIRLLFVNAPERKGATRVAGDAALVYVREWLDDDGTDEWPMILMTIKADSFGRFLARCWRVSDGASLNDDLIASGHAVPFKE